jgi:hypothetical protein
MWDSIFADSSESHVFFLQLQGVEYPKHNQDQFRFRRAAFYSQFKSKVVQHPRQGHRPTYQH